MYFVQLPFLFSLLQTNFCHHLTTEISLLRIVSDFHLPNPSYRKSFSIIDDTWPLLPACLPTLISLWDTYACFYLTSHLAVLFFFYRLLPSTYPFRQILLYWHWLLLGSQTQFVCTCVCVFSWYWQGVCRFTQFWCHLTGDSTILPRLRAPSYQTTLHFPLQMSFASPRLLLTSYRWEVSTTFRLGLINFLEWFTELGKTLRFTSLIKDIVKNTS